MAALLLVSALVLPVGAPPARAGVTPPGRWDASITYDAASQKVLLFGGQDPWGQYGDTWTWNGSGWKRHFPTVSPSRRARAAMAYDGATGTVVLFGGYGLNVLGECCFALGDTWIWDWTTKTWTEHVPLLAPPPKDGARMAYDSANRKVVLVAGDTWTWDGNAKTWTRELLESPSSTFASAMAYHKPSRRVVLFTREGETWTWDGSAKSWSQQFPPTSPPPRWSSAMAYDAARKRTVLFGGRYLNDTWTWDGATWAQATPLSSPSPREHHAMAYHPPTQRIVLFGGYDQFDLHDYTLGDTWIWNGTNWKQRA